MPIPQELINIQQFLTSDTFSLSRATNDWRINSAVNEDEIKTRIKSRFTIVEARARERYDFAIQSADHTKYYYVNIKVTETTNADNLNCKLWVYYALTWRIPPFKNEVNWNDYLRHLKNDMQETSEDYYFLIVNKNNTRDIFVTWLKWLSSLQVNWNNLPFQAKWDDNRVYVERTYEEAKQFLLGTFWDSLRNRADAYFTFQRLFDEYDN